MTFSIKQIANYQLVLAEIELNINCVQYVPTPISALGHQLESSESFPIQTIGKLRMSLSGDSLTLNRHY